MVVLEWLATSSNEKSERRKAASSTSIVTVSTPKSAYIEVRPTATHSGRRARAP